MLHVSILRYAKYFPRKGWNTQLSNISRPACTCSEVAIAIACGPKFTSFSEIYSRCVFWCIGDDVSRQRQRNCPLAITLFGKKEVKVGFMSGKKVQAWQKGAVCWVTQNRAQISGSPCTLPSILWFLVACIAFQYPYSLFSMYSSTTANRTHW